MQRPLNGGGKLDQLERFSEDEFVRERVIGTRQIVVSRHKQHGSLRLCCSDAGRKLAAIHDRHDKVDQGKIDSVDAVQDIKRRPAAIRLDNVIIEILQRLYRQFPDCSIVIYDEDGRRLALVRDRSR